MMMELERLNHESDRELLSIFQRMVVSLRTMCLLRILRWREQPKISRQDSLSERFAAIESFGEGQSLLPVMIVSLLRIKTYPLSLAVFSESESRHQLLPHLLAGLSSENQMKIR